MEKIPSNEKPFKTLLYSFLVAFQVLLSQNAVAQKESSIPQISHIDLRNYDEKIIYLEESLRKYSVYVKRYLSKDSISFEDLKYFAENIKHQIQTTDSLVNNNFPGNDINQQNVVPVLSLLVNESTFVNGVYYEKDSTKFNDYALICLFHFLHPNLFTGTHETWHQLKWQNYSQYKDIYNEVVGEDRDLYKRVAKKLYPFVEKVKFNKDILDNLDSDFEYFLQEIENQGRLDGDSKKIVDNLVLNMLIIYNRSVKDYLRSDIPKEEEIDSAIMSASEEIARHFVSIPEFLPFLMQYKDIIEDKYLKGGELTSADIDMVIKSIKSSEDPNQIEALFSEFTEEQLKKLLQFTIDFKEN